MKKKLTARNLEVLLDSLLESPAIYDGEEGPEPIFTGLEMKVLEEHLRADDDDAWGFWRNWVDGTPPIFKENRLYYTYFQNGWYCFGPFSEAVNKERFLAEEYMLGVQLGEDKIYYKHLEEGGLPGILDNGVVRYSDGEFDFWQNNQAAEFVHRRKDNIIVRAEEYMLEVQKEIEKMEKISMKTITMGLCKGRHEIKEVQSYIFGDIKDPTDVERLEVLAFRTLWYECMDKGCLQLVEDSYEEVYRIRPNTKLDLYVTGLTVALIAALNVAREQEMEVTLYHFDRESGGYYPQEVK